MRACLLLSFAFLASCCSSASKSGAGVSDISEFRLWQARALIADAKANKARIYAPKTLAEAEGAVNAAERAIAENPQNDAAFRQPVRRADRFARLLVAVNATARSASGRSEEEIARAFIRRNSTIAEMRSQLKGVEAEAELQRRSLQSAYVEIKSVRSQLESERKMSETFDIVRGRLDRNEANVYREGDRLLIQLKALGFAPGSAELPKHSQPLLNKVKGVIETMHPQDIVVEGHADETGSVRVNKEVSRERAQAVARYLSRSATKVEAVGRGAREPIRTNKTPAGRAANRRVDLVITPSVSRR